MRPARAFAAGALAMLLAYPAAAQKSEDTVRIGMAGALATIGTYYDSSEAARFLSHGLYDTLIAYDERAGRYQPLLASSWQRIDDRTIDFEIRDDVTWHDGTALDVYDVFYTLDWLSRPDTKLHLQHQWSWIDHVEKLGRRKVRLISKRPTPFDLARIAFTIPIVPEHRHGQLLDERFYFGRSPIGTGPYRFVRFDEGHPTVESTGTYRHGGAAKPVPRIERVRLHTGWDYDERIAEFRDGALDVLLDADPKTIEMLARERSARVTPVAGYGMLVLAFDARGAGRPLADPRVRRALALATDRAALAKAMPPGGRMPVGLCWPDQAGCGTPPPAPEYDPAQARALLAEAGERFELTISAHGAWATMQAELLARQWQAVGIGVRVETVSAEQLYIRQRDRTAEAVVFDWHAGAMADVEDMVQTFFAPGPWDRHEDPILHALAATAGSAMDAGARRAAVRQALDHANGNNYAFALSPFPNIVLHDPDISIDSRGRYGASGFSILDLNWK